MINTIYLIRCDICKNEVGSTDALFPAILPYTYDPHPEKVNGVKDTSVKWAQFDLCADCRRNLANAIKQHFVNIESMDVLPSTPKMEVQVNNYNRKRISMGFRLENLPDSLKKPGRKGWV